MKETGTILLGKIIKLERSFFKVKLEEMNKIVDCTISGKLRKNNIKVVLGDNVKVEVCPYDCTKGRIVYREK